MPVQKVLLLLLPALDLWLVCYACLWLLRPGLQFKDRLLIAVRAEAVVS